MYAQVRIISRLFSLSLFKIGEMKKLLLKYIIVSIFLSAAASVVKAQTWAWAKSSGGTGGGQDGSSVNTDVAGNIFIAGAFYSPTIIFDTYTLNNAGNYDGFITKYNSVGNVIWTKSFGGVGQDLCYSVCTDINGNAFITGYFSSPTITFGSYTLTNNGSQNVYITKFDSNGNVLWAKSAIGSGNDCAYSISTDGSGNSIITGYFGSPTIIFGAYTLTNTGSSSIFIVKYDPNGNVLWAKSSIGSSWDNGYSVSTDAAGNIFSTGSYSGATITFNTFTLANIGGTDGFITKYDSNGNALWAKTIGGVSLETGLSVCTDAIGDAIVTGYFQTPTISIGSFTLTKTGNKSMFLAKYNSNGSVIWATTPISSGGTPGEDVPYSVSSYSGNIFVTGKIGSPIMTFGTYTLSPPAGIDNMFIALYDLNGNVIYATFLRGGGDDENAVSIDRFCNVYVTSDFSQSPLIVGTNTLTNPGNDRVFTAKLSFTNNCQPLPDGLSQYSSAAADNSQYTLFPNPNSGFFKIQIDNEIKNGELILINSLGQKVFEKKIFQGENNIRATGLSSGLYNCILLQDNRQMSCSKLSIE